MGPQVLPRHSQCQGSARAQAPNGEVRGGYPADCIAPASPDYKKFRSQRALFFALIFTIFAISHPIFSTKG